MEGNWKDIEGFEGLYQVSDCGEVRSLDRKVFNGKTYYQKYGQLITPSKNRSSGYLKVGLWKDGTHHNRYIHHLVFEAFVGKRDPKLELNHIDENSLNNCLENLEQVTPLVNKRHGTRIERCAKGHLKPIEVTFEDGTTKVFGGTETFHAGAPTIQAVGNYQSLEVWYCLQRCIAKEHQIGGRIDE